MHHSKAELNCVLREDKLKSCCYKVHNQINVFLTEKQKALKKALKHVKNSTRCCNFSIQF